MSTFCSDAGSQIIFFSTIFFSISNAHRSSNENMVSLHQMPDCSEEEVTPPPKGYVIDLYTHLVMTASSRTPPPITSHSLHIAECLALCSLYHFIYFLKQEKCPSCIF